MFIEPYAPTPKTKKRLAATTTSGASSRTQITNATGSMQVRVRSLSANTVDAYFAFGDSTVVADFNTDEGISPGAVEVFTVNVTSGPLFASVITESGTATVEIGVGVGS